MLNTLFKELIARIGKWFEKRDEAIELEKSVQGRFLRLFKEHGIHKNQIPSFFGHGITLQDVESPEKLFGCLSPEILKDASEMFGVSLAWLQGADDTIFPIHPFYKRVSQFSKFVEEIKSDSDFIRAHLYLSTDQKWERDSVLVLSKKIGTTGAVEVYRHYLCADWIHKYGKCRADLVACTAILMKQGSTPRITWVKKPLVQAAAGLAFPSSMEAMKTDASAFSTVSRFFGAEKWISNLNDFEYLVDDSEYERATAIAGWLEHYRNGFMDIGGNQGMDDVAAEFEARLKQLEGS